MELADLLKENEIRVSVPCRIDLGGTLDISTFYLPFNFLSPSSFNIAIDMRTYVTLRPFKKGFVKVSSLGFESAEFASHTAPFDHPMGLMFAMADYFNCDGVHLIIKSSSPPRSALGGSSSAAVALSAAFLTAINKRRISGNEEAKDETRIDVEKSAWIAHYVESSVAGVPCGMQDQLAAAFGGVNQWFWKLDQGRPSFIQNPLFTKKQDISLLNKSMLVAYCGIPHVSSQVNKKWVNQFICGENRDKFEKIIHLTDEFVKAMQNEDFSLAGKYMNQETEIRLEMTPQVLDSVGKKLFKKALELDVGARFTGAGGGGCLWAIGDKHKIKELRSEFNQLLKDEKDAKVLKTAVDSKGIIVYE